MLQFLVQARREGGRRDESLTPFDWSRPRKMFGEWLGGNWRLLAAAAGAAG